MRFKNVHVQTNGILTEEQLSNVVQTELAGDYFGFWPKDSIVSMPQEHIATVLQNSFPRIEIASVKRTGLYTISTIVEEREPVALWCGDVVPPTAHERLDSSKPQPDDAWGTCYLLDKKGYIYAQAPLFSGNIFPRYYGSLEHGEPLAQQYIPAPEFQIWLEFYTTFEAISGDVPQALLFVDERDVELYLTNGYRILIPRQEDLGVISRRLQALFESDSIKDEVPVEYIDLRFGNKAFVKYLSTSDNSPSSL
jgi:hypothetical protein